MFIGVFYYNFFSFLLFIYSWKVEKYFRKYPDELTLKEFHEIEGNFLDDFMTGSALEQMEVNVVDFTTGTTGTIESLDTAFNQYIR